MEIRMTQHAALLLFASLLAGCAQHLPMDSAVSGHASMDHAAHMRAMADPHGEDAVDGHSNHSGAMKH